MKNFTDIANRLKTVLSITQDKQIAEFLGLSKSAYAERKRRGVFPESSLRLAELKYPELNLDINYIMTGEVDLERYKDNEMIEGIKSSQSDAECKSNIKVEIPMTPADANTSILLNFDELRLLGYFRKSDMKGKQLMLDTGKMCKEYSYAVLRWTEYTEKDILKYTKEKS